MTFSWISSRQNNRKWLQSLDFYQQRSAVCQNRCSKALILRYFRTKHILSTIV
jgi:hypothetical protein